MNYADSDMPLSLMLGKIFQHAFIKFNKTLKLRWVCRLIDTGFWMVGPPSSDIILLEAVMKSENEISAGNQSGCLLRLYWMLLGNVIVLASVGMMVKTGSLLLYGSAFIVIAASIIIARYADIRYFNGHKADASGPASMADWKKYAVSASALYLIILIATIVIKFRF